VDHVSHNEGRSGEGGKSPDGTGPDAFENRLRDAEIIAILRGLTPDATTSLALELQSLGVRFVEVTIQDDQGVQALRQTVSEWQPGPSMIGAGSIISTSLAGQAIDDGAEFLVSPGLSSEVISIARRNAVPILPGVATPSEVQTAAELGLTAVKLFPAAQLGGPAYLRALAGPFPSMRFVPTGGVDFQNAPTYLTAGALAVGIGGQLTKPSGLEALRDWIHGRAERDAAQQSSASGSG
jgi:2-dehydro-3-deoxyphosphogluconate aldolase/(4S)-4-hydroxy-2-oxoglutarate aldolase